MEFSAPAIVYQALLFTALYFILRPLVFDPFLANLDARHQRTRGALEEAAKLRTEVARLQADYEEQMSAIRRQAAEAREEIRKQAESEERELLESARAEAARALARARERIAAEVAATRAALEADMDRLTDEVIARLLKRGS